MVIVPPRIAVKPIGMSSCDSGMPVRAEIRLTTGRNSAAAPTFCMKEEMKPTVEEMIGMIRASLLPPIRRIQAATLFMIPVRSSPAPMIITAMIEITALELNPANRCSMSASPPSPGRVLNSPISTITISAARSTRTSSLTNNVTVKARSPSTTVISTVSVTASKPQSSLSRDPHRVGEV